MFRELLQDAITLFVIIDPIGNVPIFLALTRHLDPPARRKVAGRAIVASACVLLAFLLVGQHLLAALGIGLPAFKIAGGVVVFLFGLQMVFETEQKNKDVHGEAGHDIAIFPLAFPMIAGPASMLTVVLLTQPGQAGWAHVGTIAALLVAILGLTWVLFLRAEPIQRVLGRAGSNLISRFLGMLLAALAAQTVLGGLAEFFHLPLDAR
jgi:multiple antibiotic resistance protein